MLFIYLWISGFLSLGDILLRYSTDGFLRHRRHAFHELMGSRLWKFIQIVVFVVKGIRNAHTFSPVEERTDLIPFPLAGKWDGRMLWRRRMWRRGRGTRKTPTPKLRLFKVYYERRLEIRTWNECVRMCVYLLFSLITLSLLSSN